ncbi:E3 ubiquitin-protein ligase RNF180 isoform X1, partial [Arapaima gigas]
IVVVPGVAVAMETTKEGAVLRCRRCRMCVVDSSDLLQVCMRADDADVAAQCNIWHVNVDPLPAWILSAVQQAAWTMGRLKCVRCGARLGGFSFVTQPLCPCGRALAVHLSKSRVDHDRREIPPMAHAGGHSDGYRLGHVTSLTDPQQAPATDTEPPGSTEELALPSAGCRPLGEEENASAAPMQRVPPPSDTQNGARDSRWDRNHLKSLRRKQRRRERWLQSHLQVRGSSSEDEDGPTEDREGLTCAVCLDLYFSPYTCHPCGHVFCEPCLRTLARSCPCNTPCPLCRTAIAHVIFHRELGHAAKTCFPKEYAARRHNFQKASCAKWPLPSCRKIFRIFGGLRRRTSPPGRRQFPHGGYRLDALAFQDDSRGWRVDMDMIIVYIYSVNWVIGFFVFCFLCYFFISSL